MTPAPLTPADCDLRGLEFMPLEIGRLLDSDTYSLSTGDEFKAAFTLWLKSWLQVPAASIPADERLQARLAGVSVTDWRGLAERALHGWQLCSDGRLYHPVIAEKALTAWLERLTYQERSAKGNAVRYGREPDSATFAKASADGLGCLFRLNPKLAAKYGKLPQGEETAPSRSPPPILQGGKNAPKGKGKGKGKLPPVGAATAAPADPNKEAWQRGVAILTTAGLKETAARAFFGKLLKDNVLEGRDLLPSVVKAEGLGTADPHGYLSKAARAVAGRRGAQTTAAPTCDEWTNDHWRVAVRDYRAGQGWSEAWGPNPDQPGCRAPDELLGEKVVPIRLGVA
jgi:hypothetical protein